MARDSESSSDSRDCSPYESRLPRGRHGLPREFVERNQRERLTTGAIKAVEERGFAKVTVADIARHAEVSRRTFYQHFKNKEECIEAVFGSSLELLAAQEMKQRLGVPALSSPLSRSKDPAQASKLPRGRHGLSREVVERNQRERLTTGAIKAVEERGFAKVTVGDITRHAEVSRRTFYQHFRNKEECLDAAFGSSPGSERVQPEKRGLSNPNLTTAAVDSEDPPQSSRPSRGRHDLPQEFVEQNKRERLITAAAKAAEERGVEKVTIADIIRHAKVSRLTFYKHFSSKEECLEAAVGESASPESEEKLTGEG